jgi:predicted aconitase with swiveling domain
VFVLRAERATGHEVEGEALVSLDAIHFTMDIDPVSGIVTGKGHSLHGKSIVDKILVIAGAKGGIASASAILELVGNGCGPKGLLYRRTNPVMVQGAIVAGIPCMDGFELDPVESIKSGDWLRVRPGDRVVEIIRE